MSLFERKKEGEPRPSTGMHKEYQWVCLNCGLINETTASTSSQAKCSNCGYDPKIKELYH